jgi:hypothetical protein
LLTIFSCNDTSGKPDARGFFQQIIEEPLEGTARGFWQELELTIKGQYDEFN